MEPIQIPIDGVLDLHHFAPQELASLLHDYLGECRRHGILDVRLIHGKGTGTLRRRVHALLGNMPEMVQSFRTASGDAGGWGATQVQLHPITIGYPSDGGET